MDPSDATTPDPEIDEFTGKLRRKFELKSQSLVYSPLNRNLLYTKSEINTMIASGGVLASTTFPNPAPAGKLVYRTDLMILFLYQGSWKPISSFGDLTLYIDKTNGSDAVGQGYSSGSGATKTWQYAFDLIPPMLGGNVVVNISGDAYTESPTLEGKKRAGPYTITIQGTTSVIESLVAAAGSLKGSTLNGSSNQYGTFIRDSGSWTLNQRQNKWAKVAATGEARLIDYNDAAQTARIVGVWGTAPTIGQVVTIEEPLTSITDLRIGTGQDGVIINDIDMKIATGTNQQLFGANITATLNRCRFPQAGATSIWTNKNDNLTINYTYFTFVRLFIRNGANVVSSSNKFFRTAATNHIQIDESSKLYLADGTVIDGNNDASVSGIAQTGLGLVNYNGNAAGQAATLLMNTIRKCAVGVKTTAFSPAVNAGYLFNLLGDDKMTALSCTISSVSAGKLIDTASNFTTLGIIAGDKVQNLTAQTYALVVSVDSATQLTLDDDIMTGAGSKYRIVDSTTLNTNDFQFFIDAGALLGIQSGTKNAAVANLFVGGSFGRFVRNITAARTLTVADSVVTASGTFAVTFPTASGIVGREYQVTNSGKGLITLNTTGGQPIDDNASGIMTLAERDSIAVMAVQRGTNLFGYTVLKQNNVIYGNGGKTTFQLADTTANVGLTIGGDTNLYRSAANALATDDSFKVAAGASTSFVKVGGSLFDHFTDANNGTTVETDLYSDTLPAATLATNGDKIVAQYGGIFTGAATATQQLKAYFGGTLIFDSGALSIGVATDSWNLFVTAIRVSASVVRCAVTLTTNFATLSSYATYTEVTGLTLANTQILKITGTAAGAAGASNQITAKEGYVEWKSAA